VRLVRRGAARRVRERPPPLDWQLNARGALAQYERYYFAGENKLAEREFENAKQRLLAPGGWICLRALSSCVALRALRASSSTACPGFASVAR
jgi:hypothetical protein